MKPREPEQVDTDALFSADLRAELRRELSPSAAAKGRVRDALLSSVATGTISPAAQRVDTLLHAKAATAAGAKAAAAATVHSLTAKLVIAGVLVGGGATAVMLRGPSADERPAAVSEARATTQPVLQVPSRAANEARAVPQAADSPVEAPTEIVRFAEPQPAADPVKRSVQPARRRGKPLPLSAANTSHVGTEPAVAEAATPSASTREPAPVPPPKSIAAVAPEQPVPASVAPAPEAARKAEAAPAPETARKAEAAPAPEAARKAEAAPKPEAAPKHALAAEIALVRAASEALQRNAPEAALMQLQRHSAEFPRGALRVEAEALRAIALCTTQSAQAAAVSGKFLKAHAGSPLAERVRRACTEP